MYQWQITHCSHGHVKKLVAKGARLDRALAALMRKHYKKLLSGKFERKIVLRRINIKNKLYFYQILVNRNEYGKKEWNLNDYFNTICNPNVKFNQAIASCILIVNKRKEISVPVV